jgi:hypothetical protein
MAVVTAELAAQKAKTAAAEAALLDMGSPSTIAFRESRPSLARSLFLAGAAWRGGARPVGCSARKGRGRYVCCLAGRRLTGSGGCFGGCTGELEAAIVGSSTTLTPASGSGGGVVDAADSAGVTDAESELMALLATPPMVTEAEPAASAPTKVSARLPLPATAAASLCGQGVREMGMGGDRAPSSSSLPSPPLPFLSSPPLHLSLPQLAHISDLLVTVWVLCGAAACISCAIHARGGFSRHPGPCATNACHCRGRLPPGTLLHEPMFPAALPIACCDFLPRLQGQRCCPARLIMYR